METKTRDKCRGSTEVRVIRDTQRPDPDEVSCCSVTTGGGNKLFADMFYIVKSELCVFFCPLVGKHHGVGKVVVVLWRRGPKCQSTAEDRAGALQSAT